MLKQELEIESVIADKLLSPTYSLLVNFKTKAPGSFQHCERVMNYMEKCGLALHLNIDICKIIGMYHDIGKSILPIYFSENQSKDINVHDTLDPKLSHQILISHVAHGASILTEQCQEMPTNLIKVMMQHHGNGVLKGIHSKVKDTASEDEFRYPHKKPDNVYAGTLMICDTIEAAIKSMTQAETPLKTENISDTIRKIIGGMIDSGQLDSMTHGDTRVITDVLINEYDVINSKRVEYPDNHTEII